MNKNDLRYKKTEDSLKRAFLKLLKDHQPNDITVKQICETAECSRNTFYLHYDVKDDLYYKIIDTILTYLSSAFVPEVNDQLTNDEVNRIYTDRIIDRVIANKDALEVLIQKDDGIFFKQFTETIYKACMSTINQITNHNPTITNEIYTAYLASSIAGFIFKWFEHPEIDVPSAKNLLYEIHRKTIDTTNNKIIRPIE